MSLRGTIAASVQVSMLNFLGKVLGLVKTLVVAWTFGASGIMDAFLVAYMLPTVIPNVLKGIVSATFIPRYMNSLQDASTSRQWKGVNTLFTVVLATVAFLAALMVASPLVVVDMIAPGLAQESRETAGSLLRIMSMAAIVLGLNAILSAVAYAQSRFVVASLEGVVSNVFIITTCFVWVPEYGVWALAYAVVAGFAAQCLLLVLANWETIVRFLRPAASFTHPDLQASLKHTGPLAIGFAGAIMMDIVDQVFASYVGAGAIAILSYATMLALVPIEIFGHAVRTAFYTTFSRLYSTGNIAGLAEAHRRGIGLLIFFMIPASAVFIAYSEQLVDVLFERGRFKGDDGDAVAWVVVALSVGMFFKAASWFNFAVFHAMIRPWIPVGVGLSAVVVNVALTWILVQVLGVAGIALATSLAVTMTAIVTSVLLARVLRYRVVVAQWPVFWRVSLMSAAMILTAKLLSFGLLALIPMENGFYRSLWELFMLVPGVVVFVAIGVVFRLPELSRGRRYLAEWITRHRLGWAVKETGG